MARYSYPLPRGYRIRYPYRLRMPAGRRDRAIALAVVLAVVLFGGAAVRHLTPAVTAPVTSGSENAFITAVLADLGAPDTPADVTSLADWFPHEYPSWPPAAADNPMSSKLAMPGSAPYNPDGVQDYPTAAEGAQATALTLEDGYYPLIVAALRSGAGLCGNPSLAGEFATWSGGGYYGVC